MAGIGNNLYPAIIQTYMPAFVYTNECKVYFSLSNYNSKNDIKNVQIIVSNQNSNQSVLNKSKYLTEIMIKNLMIDEKIDSDYKYYITINYNDIEGGFQPNQFYKVQLRFTGTGASGVDMAEGQVSAAWLVNNQGFFSEWSTVCIIKSIYKPSLNLQGFEGAGSNASSIFTSEVSQIAGNLSFLDKENNITNDKKEILKHYKISIFKKLDNELVYKTDEIYPLNENEINYTIKYKLEDGTAYLLVFEYMTNNGYVETNEFSFSVIQTGIDGLNVKLEATMEADYGRMRLDVTSLDNEIFLGNISIRRSSNESNFTIWEDVKTAAVADGGALNLVWYDYTVKSGVWYKYGIQKRNSAGSRSIITYIDKPVLAIFDDIFLTNKDMQICIKYDPIIASYRKTISESRVETIGSKYPYFKRNANIEYKQFPISGLITSYCDEDGIFINKENVYGDMQTAYQQYNEDSLTSNHYDYIYEREFRERVEKFLYANTVKLFRSLTEGNVLVKLMDISFTPNQTLGRLLYSFNATAYEIDECSIENYNKYNIQIVGNYSSNLKYSRDVIGQVAEMVPADTNLLDILQEKYNNQILNNFINVAEYFKWVRLEFNDKPYLIEIAEDGSVAPATEYQEDKNYTNGYIVEVDGKSIVVNSRGYFELMDEDTQINSIQFPVDTDIIFDYMVRTNETEDTSKAIKRISYYTRVGQLFETFQPDEKLYNKIYAKYYLENKKEYQRIISINSINLEFEPNTVIYVKDSEDMEFYKHVMNPTGVLHLKDEDATILDFYVGGIQLYSDIDQNSQKQYQYYIADGEFGSISEVVSPRPNYVYTIAGEQLIFFRNNWYPFADDVVKCPVDGLIDYIYEVVKGEYNEA